MKIITDTMYKKFKAKIKTPENRIWGFITYAKTKKQAINNIKNFDRFPKNASIELTELEVDTDSYK